MTLTGSITKSGRWTWSPEMALVLAGLAAVGGGFFFLVSGPPSVEFFLSGSRAFGDIAQLPAGVLAGALCLSVILQRLGYRGELRKFAAGGVVWRRSVVSRLQAVGGDCLAAFLIPDFLAATPEFWSAGDPARAGLSVLFLILSVVAIGVSLLQLVSWQAVLAIDPAGIRSRDLPGGWRDWSEVGAVVLDDDGPDGVVTLTVDAGGMRSKRVTLNLGAAGLTGKAFIKHLIEIAPQIEVQGPPERVIDFGAA